MNRANELRYLVVAAQREGSRFFTEQLRPLGLTPSQAEVLGVLHEAQPLSLVELGARLVCETGSPSRLVDGLVKAELVERVPSATDQRKVTLSLTQRGEELYVQVAEIEQRLNTVFSNVDNQGGLEVLREVLWQFVQDKPAGRALALRLQREET